MNASSYLATGRYLLVLSSKPTWGFTPPVITPHNVVVVGITPGVGTHYNEFVALAASAGFPTLSAIDGTTPTDGDATAHNRTAVVISLGDVPVDGVVSAFVDEDVFTDWASNNNTASGSIRFAIDRVRPSVALATTRPEVSNATTAVVTVWVSEQTEAPALGVDGLTVVNALVASWAVTSVTQPSPATELEGQAAVAYRLVLQPLVYGIVSVVIAENVRTE